MGKILVIAEKPSVGKSLAKFLKCNDNKKNYIEGNKYIVTWAFGHLATLKEPEDYIAEDKVWSIERLPIIPKQFGIKVNEATRGQFEVIKALINRSDVDSLINAGDSGREGELIQRYIYSLAGNTKPIKRLWVSSMTEDSFRKGFNELKDQSDFDNLYEAAVTRGELDWLYGLNYTRAFTKKYGNSRVLSVGRCQTPILKLITDRDKAIDEFVPKEYFELEADFGKYKGKYIKNKTTRIDTPEEVAALIKKLEGNEGEIVSLTEEKKEVPAPLLYNLSSLSQKMNTKYGFTAQKTLDVLQVLYEQYKIATYPRASAEVISDSIYDLVSQNIDRVLFGNFKNVGSSLNIKKDKRYVNDAKIEDHHAIIPDFSNKNIESIYPKLNKDEKNLFDELVKSILAIFLPKYEYSTTTLITKVKDEMFFSRGKQQLNLGWRTLYSDEKNEDKEEFIINNVAKGDKNKIVKLSKLSKKTKPEARYTDALILKEMVKYNIGTEATRAGIIETLLKRGYIERNKKAIISTKLGKDFINIIKIEDIKSVEFTSDIENKLTLIADGKLKKDSVINEVAVNLRNNIETIKNDKATIDVANSVGICPKCGGKVTKNKSGYGCSNHNSTGCNFFIGTICGKELSLKQITELLSEGKTSTIKGFKSKEGKSFDAALILNKDTGKLEFSFNNTNNKNSESDKICPKCKKPMFDNDKVCKCSDCDIVIFKNICGKKISNTAIKQLLSKGETSLIKGFKSKKGTEFDAHLVLNGGRVELKFDKK